MNINFTLNRFLYFLSNDPKVEQIENILQCQIYNKKGKYFGRYTSYLAVDYVNTDKIPQLEYALKTHIEVVKKDFNFIIKVYHKHCKLPTYVEYEPYNGKDLVLGIGFSGLIKVPMNSETNNYLICGCSGSGKSTLAIAIIKNLIDNDVEVIICDNKSSFDYDGLNAPVHKGIEACLYQLDKFEVEIDKRMKENKRHAQKLLIIDEIFPFLTLDTKERKRVMNQLALILSKCRSVNCHVMIITQRATTDIIDSKILANISNRICLATSSKQESINVLNCDVAYDLEIKGRAYISINGKLQQFQSYYYKPPKISQNATVENIDDNVKIENRSVSKFL